MDRGIAYGIFFRLKVLSPHKREFFLEHDLMR